MVAIAALGDVDIDLLMTVDGFPRPGEESFARHATIGLGGSAVNTAAALTRLGFEVSILAQVGDDEFGSRARTLLTETGIHTDHLLVSEEAATGMNVVVVTPDGERTMLGLRGANRFYRGTALDGFGWLHLSAYALLEEPQRSAARAALSEARRREIPISIDIPSGVAHRLGAELADHLRDVSVVSVGRESLRHLFPGADPVGDLLAGGVSTLAATDGRRPFVVTHGSRSVTITPPEVETVDTTGAGDSFVAGLVAGTLWRLDPGPIAVLAGVLGAAAAAVGGSGSESLDGDSLRQILDGWTDVDPGWREAVRGRLG